MQDAATAMSALSEVNQDSVMDEEAALHAAAEERLHASPVSAFDFESLLQGPSQLPEPVRHPTALEQPQIRLDALAAMPRQDMLVESSLLHHLSDLRVRCLLKMQMSKVDVQCILTMKWQMGYADVSNTYQETTSLET